MQTNATDGLFLIEFVAVAMYVSDKYNVPLWLVLVFFLFSDWLPAALMVVTLVCVRDASSMSFPDARLSDSVLCQHHEERRRDSRFSAIVGRSRRCRVTPVSVTMRHW